MSLWNPENIRDASESVGVNNLKREVIENLARDVDYQLSLVLDEALKFMRHAKRTTLETGDISQALRVLDVEPLFGYESTRPLRFGEASIGPGQPLFYIEDEEVDFEKLINAPLPKVPREMLFSAHWLAVEGVQPSIPQNPTSTDPRHQDLLPKGPGANPNLGALAGLDSVTGRPQVKHILSSEIQLYFERITTAILDESNEEYRNAAFNSLRTDPGLHQLVPYFIQYSHEKVTHGLKELFILNQMLTLLSSLLDNRSLYLDPYVGKMIAPILTCLEGRKLGSAADAIDDVFELRDFAASLLIKIARAYGKASPTLSTKLARSLLKTFLDPNATFGSQYGALVGFIGLTGTEGIRLAIVPNIKMYDDLLKEGLADEGRQKEAQKVVLALLAALRRCATETRDVVNGEMNGADAKERVIDKIGEVMGKYVIESGDSKLMKAVLEADVHY